MSKQKQELLLQYAKSGSLSDYLNRYLEACRVSDGADGKKKHGLFPNLAGFCRWIGCGFSAWEALKVSFPDLFDRITAVFEDEALNSDLSPTLLSAYLKRRLGYGDKPEPETVTTDCGQMRLVFEHDVLEDGS